VTQEAGVTDDGSSLEGRVARQETAEGARRLIAGYARAVDAQDAGALAALCAPTIVITTGGVAFRGLGEVRDFFTGDWSNYPATRRHFVTNVAMDALTPTSAQTSASFLFVSAAEDVPRIGWGAYRFTFERQASGDMRIGAIEMSVEVDVDIRSGWAAELADAGGPTP
jgi:hypothetical protein